MVSASIVFSLVQFILFVADNGPPLSWVPTVLFVPTHEDSIALLVLGFLFLQKLNDLSFVALLGLVYPLK
jgi:hypothetical protein